MQLTIEKLVYGGDGLARTDQGVIFVPRTALESLTVLAVIGATRRRRPGVTADTGQVQLFGE